MIDPDAAPRDWSPQSCCAGAASESGPAIGGGDRLFRTMTANLRSWRLR